MTDAESGYDWLDGVPRAFDRAPVREKGTYFEEFADGETRTHSPGLRLTRAGNEFWMSQTLNHDPAYWRPDAARDRGFEDPPVHPDYLLACTMGPSVEDLSEKGGYFLGRTDVRFPRGGVSTGTDLRVESTVRGTRGSTSRPAYGIVTWETRGVDAATGEVLCSYERTNMVPRRDPPATDGGSADAAGSGTDGGIDDG
ncbi:MAG: acyl dehydratase, partial [Haloferacaceae archaeon]